jgi:hypothetical protein
MTLKKQMIGYAWIACIGLGSFQLQAMNSNSSTSSVYWAAENTAVAAGAVTTWAGAVSIPFSIILGCMGNHVMAGQFSSPYICKKLVRQCQRITLDNSQAYNKFKQLMISSIITKQMDYDNKLDEYMDGSDESSSQTRLDPELPKKYYTYQTMGKKHVEYAYGEGVLGNIAEAKIIMGATSTFFPEDGTIYFGANDTSHFSNECNRRLILETILDIATKKPIFDEISGIVTTVFGQYSHFFSNEDDKLIFQLWLNFWFNEAFWFFYAIDQGPGSMVIIKRIDSNDVGSDDETEDDEDGAGSSTTKRRPSSYATDYKKQPWCGPNFWNSDEFGCYSHRLYCDCRDSEDPVSGGKDSCEGVWSDVFGKAVSCIVTTFTLNKGKCCCCCERRRFKEEEGDIENQVSPRKKDT